LAKVIQQILNTDVNEPAKIEEILTATIPVIREDVIKTFRFNQDVRMLYPEYAYYFDNRPAV